MHLRYHDIALKQVPATSAMWSLRGTWCGTRPHGGINGVDEDRWSHRLSQDVAEVLRLQFPHVLTSHDDNGHVTRPGIRADFSVDIDAPESRQKEIENDSIGTLDIEKAQGCDPIVNRENAEAMGGQRLPIQVAGASIVLDNQHGFQSLKVGHSQV